jgi:hypothetical protein
MEVWEIMDETVAIECPSCKGRGCPKCGYKGVQELEIDGRKVAIECPSCKGDGCPECEHTGIKKS